MAKSRQKTWAEDRERERRRMLVGEVVRDAGGRELSLRAISEALASAQGEKRSVNAQGEPWSHETIRTDLEAIENLWREHSAKDIAVHKARLLHHYEELLTTALQKSQASVSWAAEARQTVQAIVNLMGANDNAVRNHEYLTQELNAIIDRLETHYRNDPELLHEIIQVIIGRESAKQLAN